MKWRTCKWAFFGLMLSAGLIAFLYYHRRDEEIRQRVEARIAEHYSSLAVRVRSARLVPGEGVEVRGLSIHEPGVSGRTAELIYIDELFLFGDTDWRQLMKGEFSISRFLVRQPTIRISRRRDGSWSASKLLPFPKLGPDAPRGTIEGGVIEVVDLVKRPTSSITFRDANIKFGPADRSPAGARGRLKAQGSLTGDYVRRIEINTTFDRQGSAWHVSGSFEGLELSPDLARALPESAAAGLAQVQGLRAQVKARFSLGQEPARNPAFSFDVKGQVVRGRIEDVRLPHPLTITQAGFHFHPRGFELEDFQAYDGQSTVSLSVRHSGYSRQGPFSLSAEAKQLSLDENLHNVLPAHWQSEWRKFLPAGKVDAALKLEFDGKTLRPDLVVKCRDVSFTYHRFPYRLSQGRGQLELKNDHLKVDLVAQSESAEVRVAGELDQPGPRARGAIEVQGEDVAFDDKLLSALDDNPREVVRSLNPTGRFRLWMRCEVDGDGEPTKEVELKLMRCGMRYNGFPYPLDNLYGTILLKNHRWEFRNLVGRNGHALVKCDGELIPIAEGSHLTLLFDGTNVPLNEELRDALSPAAARLWRDMRPNGIVNFDARVEYSSIEKQSSVLVNAKPILDDETSLSTSIEPVYFPYRLEKLQGLITYLNGHVELKGLRAEHNRTVHIRAEGDCDLLRNGQWQLRLKTLYVDRLRVDRDLLQALSERLRKTVQALNLRGPMNLDGKVTLASQPLRTDDREVDGQSQAARTHAAALRNRDEGQSIAATWDVSIDFHDFQINCGVPLEHIFGGVSLKGRFDGERFTSAGELDIHSITYRDFMFTDVMGPIRLSDKQVLLGIWADRENNRHSDRQITAKIYGGTAIADGIVTLGAEPGYKLHATLNNADLAQCAQEVISGRQHLVGQVDADVEVRGKGRGLHNLAGRGEIALRNAELYEVPVILALLNVLSGHVPDTTAFTSGDTQFRIQGEHVHLHTINLNGNAISLEGKGEVGFDRKIHLALHALVGRGERRIPIFSDLMGGASEQILEIEIDGTLDDAKARRVLFPKIQQALPQGEPLRSDLFKTRPAATTGPRDEMRDERPQPRQGPAG